MAQKGGGPMSADSVGIGLTLAALRFSSPLILAALAGMYSERAGLAQIALEGFMLTGAFVGAVAAHYSHSGMNGLLFALIAGMIAAGVFGLMTIRLKADQIVSGTVINMLAWGLIPVASKIIFDSTAQTPTIPIAARNPDWLPLVFASIASAGTWYVMKRSRIGLNISFAGEKPEALKAVGINVNLVRWKAIFLTGALAGVSGGLLSTALSSSYTRNMVAGRGFMALAALILGKWKPTQTVLACLLFGVLDVAQLKLQGTPLPGIGIIPTQLVQMLPYLVTLILIAGVLGESKAPKVLGATES
jgi:ABC-type uncharacterized transport system permease subunit